MNSLKALKRRGTLVVFGASSGPVPPFDVNELQNHGSAYLTRPTLGHYIATRDELLWRSSDLFSWIQAGKLRVRIERTYSLYEVGKAHQDLASRATAGKLLIEPS
jgi:NADPH2:quinone reductase